MGWKDWVRKHLHWFDRQVENYPSEARRTLPPRPVQPSRPAPAVRRTPPPAAPSRARHRLGEPRRTRPDSDTDIDPRFGHPLASAAPYWIEEPEPHDHRHHGHAVDHSSTDTGGSGHVTHHHDSGGWSGGHTSHDSGGSFGGGYDGGGSSCGGGGGD